MVEKLQQGETGHVWAQKVQPTTAARLGAPPRGERTQKGGMAKNGGVVYVWSVRGGGYLLQQQAAGTSGIASAIVGGW